MFSLLLSIIQSGLFSSSSPWVIIIADPHHGQTRVLYATRKQEQPRDFFFFFLLLLDYQVRHGTFRCQRGQGGPIKVKSRTYFFSNVYKANAFLWNHKRNERNIHTYSIYCVEHHTFQNKKKQKRNKFSMYSIVARWSLYCRRAPMLYLYTLIPK